MEFVSLREATVAPNSTAPQTIGATQPDGEEKVQRKQSTTTSLGESSSSSEVFSGDGERTASPSRSRRFSTTSSLELVPQRSHIMFVIPAYAALRYFGHFFRSKNCNGAQWREEVNSIGCFWSYSRHASTFNTVSTLLLHYGGLQSAVAGCLAATVTASLMSSALVPTARIAGFVVILAASLVAVTVLLLWPSRQRIFLDRACISQASEDEKRAGILSIGYFLKQSKNLLVLWDITYLSRLWCVFEVATYLKLKVDAADGRGSGANSLKVLPAFHSGLVSVGFILLLGVFGISLAMGSPTSNWLQLTASEVVWRVIGIPLMYAVIMACLAKAMSMQMVGVARQHRQLQEFSLDKANCFCCASKHINPDTGDPMECDRELIRSSVMEWFGDVAVFDAYARFELQNHVCKGLTVPYVYVLFCQLPWLWDAVGKAAWLLNEHQYAFGLVYLLDGALSFLTYNPLVVAFTLRSFAHFCRADGAHFKHMAMATLASTVACLSLTAVWHLSVYLWGLAGYAVLSVTMGAWTFVIFRNNVRA